MTAGTARHRGLTAAWGVVLLVLAGCGTTEETPAPPPPQQESPFPDPTPEPTRETPEEPASWPGPDLPPATAEPADVLTGLEAPWDVAFLPGGAVVVTERDAARVRLLDADGVRELSGPGAEELVAGIETAAEGGLLGVAVAPPATPADDVPADDVPADITFDLLLYRTTPSGNEVVRTTLDPGAGTLGPLAEVLTGIPAERWHNGGRIEIGPDGMLWVATGDASERGTSQDPGSLGGKVLRVTPDGEPAQDNPDPSSPVWSVGHRNVQGIGWDGDGNVIASEFGQDTLDELNVLTPGDNFGWPLTEGPGGGAELVDPVLTWTPAEASPSGLAVTEDAVYVAALRGASLWKVPWADGEPAGEPERLLADALGRLRHVAVGPDGALWVLTNNTDGRGDPRDGDDRLTRLLPP